MLQEFLTQGPGRELAGLRRDHARQAGSLCPGHRRPMPPRARLGVGQHPRCAGEDGSWRAENHDVHSDRGHAPRPRRRDGRQRGSARLRGDRAQRRRRSHRARRGHGAAAARSPEKLIPLQDVRRKHGTDGPAHPLGPAPRGARGRHGHQRARARGCACRGSAMAQPDPPSRGPACCWMCSTTPGRPRWQPRSQVPGERSPTGSRCSPIRPICSCVPCSGCRAAPVAQDARRSRQELGRAPGDRQA